VNILDRMIGLVSPSTALARVRSRTALSAIEAHLAVATPGRRASSWRATRADADAANAMRARAAFVVRDMIRNTPLATRVRDVMANNVVGDGIIPKVTIKPKTQQAAVLAAMKAHFDTVAIDANGQLNLYGLQRQIIGALVESGEVLIRRRPRRISDGLPVPFQIEVLESDYLDDTRDGQVTERPGHEIREGIEFDAIGRRVAYWLYEDHPGAVRKNWRGASSRRVDASEVLHIFRPDRPGQQRGVSWLAPVALSLQDLADYGEAQLLRQKIAACFAAFVISDGDDTTPGTTGLLGSMETIEPGRVTKLGSAEDVKFASPPPAEGYDEFTKAVLRNVAAGVGITYEALTGDLRGVSYISGRMGRLEMDRHISAIQWLIMVPQFLQPLAAWFLAAYGLQTQRQLRDVSVDWVPPMRMIADPAREYEGLTVAVRSGFMSRSSVVRGLGYDNDEVTAEIVADNQASDANGLVFDSDPRLTTGSGLARAAGGSSSAMPDSEEDTDGGE
jgi:lambda family phage portal protein